MKLLRLHIVRLLLMALVVLSATTSCYNYDRPEVEMTEMAPASRYINITVAVSTSDQRVTRAPLGGEYGDGAEKGSAAENKVRNITLIFYEDATGVNTSSDDARVACVKSYVVTPVSNYQPSDHEHKDGETNDVKTNEVLYTTGDQRLDETTLQVGHTYKVIVAANVSLKVNVGDKIKTVRDTIFTSALYNVDDGTPTDFVMTSESDATVSLTNATQPSADENRFVYYFNCIHIERMAARIDFWTKNSNGYKTSANDSRYTVPGYEYTVKKPDGSASADRFVLTRITPFNLNDGGEYMLKRTNDANPYLANETTTNWVVDPNTSGKNGSAHPSYLVSKLNDVVTTFENTFTVTMANLYEKTDKTGEDTLIVAYTKENTLRPNGDTPLYYYATGLAFEGYYYAAGESQGVPRVYYYFIRHQGESNAAYNTWTPDNINDTKTTVCPSSTAMNFGIVRNNIYRISIETITEDARIKVKMWDVFTHSTIYM